MQVRRTRLQPSQKLWLIGRDEADPAAGFGDARVAGRAARVVGQVGQRPAPGELRTEFHQRQVVIGAVGLDLAHRHGFYEGQIETALAAPGDEVVELVVVDAAQGDSVYLDRQPGVFGGVQAFHDLADAAATGEFLEPRGIACIERNVHPADTAGRQLMRILRQLGAVGGQGQFTERSSRQVLAEGFEQSHDAAADERLAAGDPQLAHAQSDEDGTDPLEFLQRQDFRLGEEHHVLGHAIAAAQVAAVGYRDPQIGDVTAEGIDHFLSCPERFAPWFYLGIDKRLHRRKIAFSGGFVLLIFLGVIPREKHFILQEIAGGTEAPMPELMNTREVAEYLRIKERKIYELVREKQIPCTRVTGKWLFPRKLIDAWLAEGTSVPELVGRRVAAAPLVVGGSHDPLLEWSLREIGGDLALSATGSLDGLRRFADGETMVCALHVFDPETGEYNLPVVEGHRNRLRPDRMGAPRTGADRRAGQSARYPRGCRSCRAGNQGGPSSGRGGQPHSVRVPVGTGRY